MNRRPRSAVKVIAAGEKKPLAVVPSSVPQAIRLADRYVSKRPRAVLLIKRGEKVLDHLEPAGTKAA